MMFLRTGKLLKSRQRVFSSFSSTAVAFLWSLSSSTASSIEEEQVSKVLETISRSNSLSEISRIARSSGLDTWPSSSILLQAAFHTMSRDAATRNYSSLGLVPLQLVAAAAVEAATCHDDNTRLDILSRNDINSLSGATLYPAPTDQIRYLLEREPSLNDPELRQSESEYVSIRAQFDQNHVLVKEQTTTPYKGLAIEFSDRVLAKIDDSVSGTPGEQAQTRRVFLTALPPLILSAKFATLLPCFKSRADSALAEAILAVSLGKLSQIDAAAVDAFWSLSNAAANDLIAEQGSHEYLKQIYSVVSFQLALSAFERQRFDKASSAYQRLAQSGSSQALQRVGLWGEAVVALALSEISRACQKFAEFSSNFVTGEEAKSVVMAGIVQNLSETEVPQCNQFSETILDNTRKFIGAPQFELSPGRDVQITDVLQPIGRPDIGVRFYEGKLPLVVDRRKELPPAVEQTYLREFAAFLRDLYSQISFYMTVEDGWQPRPRAGYNLRLDFLHNLRPDGSPTGAGEIIVKTSGSPYAMGDPERDLATSIAAYGIPSNCPTKALPIGPDGDLTNGVKQFSQWVRDSLSPPHGLVVPYLKLVWIEWFSCSFETLKEGDFDPSAFAYSPAEESGLTSIEQVSALATNSKADGQQHELINLMVRARMELSRLYPADRPRESR
jgi:hypothetical protein